MEMTHPITTTNATLTQHDKDSVSRDPSQTRLQASNISTSDSNSNSKRQRITVIEHTPVYLPSEV